MLRATLPPDQHDPQHNSQSDELSSSSPRPSYSPSVHSGHLPAENLPNSSSSSSSPDLYFLRDSGTSSSSSFSSPASGYHGFRSEGPLHIIDSSNGRSGLTKGDPRIGLETEFEDGFARLLVIDQGPKETLGIGLRLGLDLQAGENNQTLDEIYPSNINQKTTLFAPDHVRLLEHSPATTLESDLPSPPFSKSSSPTEYSTSPAMYPPYPSAFQTPFLRQISSRSFVSTTTTTTTSCSPAQAYTSLPTVSRTSVHPWQIELTNHKANMPYKRARAASVRSYHSSDEEQDQEDDDDDNDDQDNGHHLLRNDRTVTDIADPFKETFPPVPRRRGHTTPSPQPFEAPGADSVHRSSELLTRTRPSFQPLTSTRVRSSKGDGERVSGPTKSAPNSSFNLAGLNPPKPYVHRARSRCRMRSEPNPTTEAVHSGGGFRQEVASLFKNFDTAAANAATVSGFRTGSRLSNESSKQVSSSSSTLVSDQASNMIPRTVTDLITAPVIPIAQGFTLLFISLATVLALSTIMMGSYGLTAWDEARIRLRDLQGRVQEGTRRIGEGVKEGRKLVDYAIDGVRVIGNGAGVGDDRFERANVNSDKPTGRPRRSSFVGRGRQNKDHPFEQVHASFWNTIGRVIRFNQLGLRFTDSTMASPSGEEHPRRQSSKRPVRGQKETKFAASRDPPLSSSSSSTSFLSTERTGANAFTSSGASTWMTSDGPPKSSIQPEISNPSTDRSTTRTFSSPPSESPEVSSSPSGRAQAKPQPRSQTYPQSQAKAKKRALPPRPPLRWLIPSIFLTLLVALGAMAYRFFGGKAEEHVGKEREREKTRERG